MREWLVAVFGATVGCAGEPTPPVAAVVEDASSEVRVESPAVGPPATPQPQAPDDDDPPPGFVSLSHAVPDVELDVRYATSDNFTHAPLPGYVPDLLWVHESTADALSQVQASLREDGLRLRVYDAYRPERASAAMFAWAQRSGQEALVRDGYIARRSNHARGNTVDVTLESLDGELLDMGTAWDTFSPGSHYAAARGTPMAHRRTLRRAMMRGGFQPYAKEWWHFTLPRPAGLPRLDVPYGSEVSLP